MNIAEQIDPVIDRLGRVLGNGQLPPPYDRWGARLLSHLTKPVQVVVTGFAGTGKTTLIEMMSARPVLGRGIKAPIVELAYGETEQMIIERADGSVVSAAGILKDIACPEGAVCVRQELCDKSLISNDFIEMGLHGDLVEKRTALNAVIERADLLIWCSQTFADEEQQLWAAVPDRMKDHSLLVLTKADQQLMRGVLADNISQLSPIVEEEFLGLFPVATIQGITAQTCADTVNNALWANSGGKHLMELLARQIGHGRTADFDQARLFMDRLAARMPQKVVTDTKTQEVMQGAEQAEVSLPDTISSRMPAAEEERDVEAVAALTESVSLLEKHAAQILDEMDNSDELDTDQILSKCSDAIHSISDLLHTAGNDIAATQGIQEDVQEGEEMLMLFQLERGEDAAMDAVTLMLQIRKELSEKLAV